METNYYEEFLKKKSGQDNVAQTEPAQQEKPTGLYDQFLAKKKEKYKRKLAPGFEAIQPPELTAGESVANAFIPYISKVPKVAGKMYNMAGLLAGLVSDKAGKKLHEIGNPLIEESKRMDVAAKQNAGGKAGEVLQSVGGGITELALSLPMIKTLGLAGYSGLDAASDVRAGGGSYLDAAKAAIPAALRGKATQALYGGFESLPGNVLPKATSAAVAGGTAIIEGRPIEDVAFEIATGIALTGRGRGEITPSEIIKNVQSKLGRKTTPQENIKITEVAKAAVKEVPTESKLEPPTIAQKEAQIKPQDATQGDQSITIRRYTKDANKPLDNRTTSFFDINNMNKTGETPENLTAISPSKNKFVDINVPKNKIYTGGNQEIDALIKKSPDFVQDTNTRKRDTWTSIDRQIAEKLEAEGFIGFKYPDNPRLSNEVVILDPTKIVSTEPTRDVLHGGVGGKGLSAEELAAMPAVRFTIDSYGNIIPEKTKSGSTGEIRAGGAQPGKNEIILSGDPQTKRVYDVTRGATIETAVEVTDPKIVKAFAENGGFIRRTEAPENVVSKSSLPTPEELAALGVVKKEVPTSKAEQPPPTVAEPIKQAEKPIPELVEPPDGMIERQTVTNTLKKVWGEQVDSVVEREKFYEPDSNKRQLEDAGNRIKIEGPEKRLDHLMRREVFTADDNAESLALINIFKRNGNFEAAQKLTKKHAQMGTITAQAQQSQKIADIINHPEIVAQRIFNEAKNKLPKKLADKLPEMTPEQIKKWSEMADSVSKMPDGPEKDIATAEIFNDIRGNIPVSVWRKVSTIQAIHQLLNLKTAARNVLGNTGMNALEMFSHYVGMPVDMLFSKITGNRSVAKPRLIKYMRDAANGFKLSIKDINRRVDTSRQSLERRTGMKLDGEFENMYNFAAGTTFKNGSVYGALEKAVGYMMQAPDRAFFEAGFWGSLDNQMRSAGKTKFEKPMIQQALKEAARLTFRDANNISNALVKIKGALNELVGSSDKSFGLGELALKYPKVPGALIKRGIEYSPFGVFGSALNIKKMIKNKGDVSAQRDAALSSARTLVGTVIAATGYAMAKAGMVTGKKPDNDKLAAMEVAMGKRPYSINAVDKWWSYDWFQPSAMPFTMGVDLAQKKELDKKGENVLSQIGNTVSGMIESAASTITDQPVLTGLSRLFGKGVTGTESGIVAGLSSMAESAPSTFIPSIVAQLASTVDPNKRNIPVDFVGRMLGLVENRTPWVSKLLNKRIDVLGKEEMRGTGNTVVDTVLNFLSPTIMSSIKKTPETEFLLQLFNETKSTEALPRIYGKNITIDNKSYTLNQSQQSKLQTIAATYALNRIRELVENGSLKNRTKEGQVKYIERIFSNAGDRARREMRRIIKSENKTTVQ